MYTAIYWAYGTFHTLKYETMEDGLNAIADMVQHGIKDAMLVRTADEAVMVTVENGEVDC